MSRKFTAIYKKTKQGYIGWVEEIPGANTQGKTLKETKENLREAVLMVLAANKFLNKKQTEGKVIKEELSVRI